MTDEPKFAPPPRDGSGFRAVVGILCLLGGMAGFFLLFFVTVPIQNRDAMMLALGLVLGWGGAVVQSEYGASSTGRKAADAAVKKIEQQP